MGQTIFPTLYIPHGGGPCFFMEWSPPDEWHKMGTWLSGLADSIGARPKALVIISAHWEERQVTIMTNPQPPLLYDYFGFPDHTYRLTYKAPGQPELAARLAQLLLGAGIHSRTDADRGFDHGVFIPMKLVYPEAEIPIVQLSLKSGLDPQTHLDIGRALAPLRGEGVLIVGSGMSYHNLASGHSRELSKLSFVFDEWLTEVCVSAPDAREKQLCDWEQAAGAREAHPREEHLLPLMVAVGAAEHDSGRRIHNDRVLNAAVSGFQFGDSIRRS
jgi:aromatic ring-opening dioxygenase catalytic subunit (LigB family)